MAERSLPHRRVLVIKLGALGDFILATGPFAAIRAAHPDAHITLLTTRPYASLGKQTGWFDDVWIDDRPRLTNLGAWLTLRTKLRGGDFDRVYDLQTSDRSGWYFRLMGPGRRPEWSGIAPGCSHPHANPRRDFMHTIERQAEQLAMADIPDVPPTDLSWVDADVSAFDLPDRYVLLVPGGAPHRPAKRWPAAHYADLAERLLGDGVVPVLIGGPDEAPLGREIAERVPGVASLIGKTDFAQIAVVAQGAAGCVGNDTGPVHIVAAAGCPTVVLFSADSDPTLTEPRGRDVTVLQRDDLALLGVDEVAASLTLR